MSKEKITYFLWSTKTRKVLTILFFLGLIYVILPGPSKIEDFSPLNPSLKSNLEGDTIQNPNIAAYFSDYRRDYITKFYKDTFQKLLLFGNLLPAITINHPPELAYTYVRDQQFCTFLEEYYYPLRESFFVCGYEPLIQNKILKRDAGELGNHIIVRDQDNKVEVFYDSKTTIRYYPTNPIARVIVYIGIWIAGFYLFKLFKKVWREN
ncbi:MAG: hypothetical protein Q7R43_01125 [Candidatus Daviesbacteria bacterium]|nr:hypothetical protein [Candidatus Daviesbacteria bacterium]